MISFSLEWLIYKAFGRLHAIHSRRGQALRRQLMDRVATIDATASIGPGATIVNHTSNRCNIVIGPNCPIHGHLMVMPQGGRIEIGQKTLVAEQTRVWSAASITIGSYVMISHNVNIHDNISHSLDWQERRLEIDNVYPHLNLMAHTFDLKGLPIVIEDDVWIGFNSTIMRGVRIGRGAVVGAGTMVTHDVEPYAIVVGNPMRVIRRVHHASLQMPATSKAQSDKTDGLGGSNKI